MLNILIADDHALVRKGVIAALSEHESSIKCEECTCIADVMTKLSAGDADLVLLDICLPDADGFSGLESIKSSYPAVPVAILSARDDEQSVRGALEAGADGYIPKASSTQVMLSAIQLILEGEVYLPSILLQATQSRTNGLTGQSSSTTRSASGLTKRQQEVLHLIEKGYSNKEIAREIFCTEGTVKAHVTAIFKLLGVNSRVKAVIAAKAIQA
ncbi:response regulator transcription factor [Vibrio sp. S9_S30]|uniref:response regulator n=1 Tax=Vibrio sp. S9_S30 TaxID=2720226 RepID=UPI001680C582|nr:response regulator transcription factor [Vibrio sp. S9_S30]MBD1556251.1 response regulator transcription factor [Vibrio sp. S9_S30]